MKNKNKMLIRVIGITLLVLLVTLAIFKIINNSVTYKITGDFTSSGGDRKYEAKLTFSGYKLINGEEYYTATIDRWCDNNTSSNCNKTTKCIIQNQNWIDSESGSECSIYNYIPTDRSELEDKIKTGEIKSFRQCGHSELCYRKTFY